MISLSFFLLWLSFRVSCPRKGTGGVARRAVNFLETHVKKH